MANIFELQSELCKAFSNPRRLEIINLLKEKEMSNSELMRETGLAKVSLAQNMNVLKSNGIVLARREGINVYYRIASPKIVDACNLMKEVLMEQLVEKKKAVSNIIKKHGTGS
jgi:ArsR family transcriptional regulator, virulence genes transcriptional regulator